MSTKKEGSNHITCTSIAAEISLSNSVALKGAQLSVFSFGFNLSGYIAYLLSKLALKGKNAVICVPYGSHHDEITTIGADIALELKLLNSFLSDRVSPIEDGTSTKERCTEYTKGGVILCSTRVFCMDLLHRRVSPDLVQVCYVLFPHFMSRSFSAGNISNAAFCVEILLRNKHADTPVKILSDDPQWMSCAVRRHRTGVEKLIYQLNITDMQLFPRFRLEFVKHYEKVGEEKPIAVECVSVPVAASTLLLDDALEKILKEIASELVKRETSLRTNPVRNTGGKTIAEKHNRNGVPLNQIEPHTGKPWRDAKRNSLFHFSKLSEEDILDCGNVELEDELLFYASVNGPQWPFKGLVESLLDVRLLRRTLRRTNQYDFFFLLEDVLGKRKRRDRSGVGSSAAAPDALWTLSPHFNDVLTIATHRIISVQDAPPNGEKVTEFDVDAEEAEEEEDNVESVPPLTPNAEEIDGVLEYIYRLCVSWGRRALKKASDETSSTMVLVCNNKTEMHSTVQRLLYSKEACIQSEFLNFLRKYRMRYGVAFSGIENNFPGDAQDTAFTVDSSVSDAELESDEGNTSETEERHISTECTRSILCDYGNNSHGDTKSLHHILLSQKCTNTDTLASKEDCTTTAVHFSLESSRDAYSILSVHFDNCPNRSQKSLIYILNGRKVSPSSFIRFVAGDHRHNDEQADRKNVVSQIIFTERKLELLRMLETVQDSLPPSIIEAVSVQIVTNELSDRDYSVSSRRERKYFQELANTKAGLVEVLMADRSKLRETEKELQVSMSSVRNTALFRKTANPTGEITVPAVIVDEREFRSTLPYTLYKRGLDIVPLTLAVSDYVLSPTFGVERKSMQDFTMSLQSGRIFNQLANLSSRFDFPICLIEFESHLPFRLLYKTAWTSSSGKFHMSMVYSKIGGIVTAYPKIKFLWSPNPHQTALFFSEFKKTVAKENEDPSSYSLTARGIDSNSEVKDAESERSHYAKQVLLKFPGVNSRNVEPLMVACGSLAGLAALNKETLERVMGTTQGNALYAFLSSPLQ